MKGFIKKVIVFLFLAVLVTIGLMIGPNYIVKSKACFEINPDITNLVLGHSQSQCAVNDSILSNSINLSNFGESYFYSYQKLKLVVGDNAQIKTVFIEFSNNHVDSIMDDWTWGYEKMSFYLSYYSPFLESEDFNVLLENNSKDILSSFSLATRRHVFRVLGNDYQLVDEIGGYSYEKLSNVDELIANSDFNSSISASQSVSETNLRYLRKMIRFCRDKDIQVFLIRSPMHTLYADLSNEAIYQNVLKTRFEDIELLDFDTMTFPNSHYRDLHHLNYKGAKQFTTLFNELIENNLLNAPNLQSLIDEKIKDFNKKQIKPSF